MAIELNDGFNDLRLGRHQLLRIKKVSHDKGKKVIAVTFEDKRGATLRENYQLKGKKAKNDVALSIFSTMAKHALGDWKVKSVEPEDLKGCYVYADVVLDQWDDDDGKHHEFKHVRNFEEADGDTFDDEDIEDEEDELDEDVDEEDEDDDVFDD